MSLKRDAGRWLTRALGLARRSPAPGWRVLLYHGVPTAPECDPGLGVEPALLRRHLEALKSDPSLRLRPLGASARTPTRTEGTELSVTFDDGYADCLNSAAPILEDLAVPYAVFAIPALSGSGDPRYLSRAQLKELAARPGCEIGAHGMTHRPLAELPLAEAKAELLDSRRWLEDLLGRPVRAVSYPFGSVNRAVRDAAEEAGYSLGFCSRTSANGPDRDPLLLCRTEIVGADGPRDARDKAYGAWDWHRLRRPDPQG